MYEQGDVTIMSSKKKYIGKQIFSLLENPSINIPLCNDEEVLISLVRRDSGYIKFISNPSNEVIKNAIRHSGFIIFHFPEIISSMNKELVLLSIKRDFNIIPKLYEKFPELTDFFKSLEEDLISYIKENISSKKYIQLLNTEKTYISEPETIYNKLKYSLKNEKAIKDFECFIESINNIQEILEC